MSNRKCPFCELYRNNAHPSFKNQFIDKTDHWMLILNKYPFVKGHMMMLLNSATHHNYYELTEDITKDISKALNLAKKYLDRLKKSNKIKRVHLIAMNENEEHHDNNRPHFHFHIIPRYQFEGPDQVRYDKFHKSLSDIFKRGRGKVEAGLWWHAINELKVNEKKKVKKNHKYFKKRVKEAYDEMTSLSR